MTELDDLEIDEDCSPECLERRATPRVPLRFGVRFNSQLELAQAVKSTTSNIGMGGLCLRTQKVYQRGETLELVIELAEGECLQLSATVAWVRPGSAVGVRFGELSEPQRKQLARVLGQPVHDPETDIGL